MSESLNIVVSGASSGIGAALSLQLASEGHQLYVCARREHRLSELASKSANIHFRACDVSQKEAVRDFAQWVKERVARIDVLVNCAGGFGAIGKMWETDSDEWLSTIQANLFGPYLTIKHLFSLLKQAERPRIINFSGGGAFNPFPRYSAYAVSKAAIVRLTETLAVELAPEGIAVNAIAPGFVATEIHDATLRAGSKAGEEHLATTQKYFSDGKVPMEVAVDCVIFLISAASDGLTGKTISAGFDPWQSQAFRENIPLINGSDLYTQRRINLVDLADSRLKEALLSAQREKGRQGDPQ